jgi:hypothetical protein
MNDSYQDKALETIIDQRLSQNNCKGALKAAKRLGFSKQDGFLQKIYSECKDEGIRNDVVLYLNTKHWIRCLDYCHPGEVRRIAFNEKKEELINKKTISEETKKCIKQCAFEKKS